MRKYQKAAVVVAMLGSVSFLGAGVGHTANGDPKVKLDNKQVQECSADEVKITGTQVADDVNTNTNAGGLQFIDSSSDTSVNCAQLFT
ncbi:hypothetical protein StrepF001_36960, partial [Streptomyces sp. F001]|uniref:hypothetical protein n=1 Tax=Streptomyces sp. F001 TaxID=1510026 RepID=UPI00101E24E0